MTRRLVQTRSGAFAPRSPIVTGMNVPFFAVILLVVAGLAGGFLAGQGSGRNRCVICGRTLSRVCAGGRCGAIGEPPDITDPADLDRALEILVGPRPPHGLARERWDGAERLMRGTFPRSPH